MKAKIEKIINRCKDVKCPLKENCYRFKKAKGLNDNNFTYKKGCKHFWKLEHSPKKTRKMKVKWIATNELRFKEVNIPLSHEDSKSGHVLQQKFISGARIGYGKKPACRWKNIPIVNK